MIQLQVQFCQYFTVYKTFQSACVSNIKNRAHGSKLQCLYLSFQERDIKDQRKCRHRRYMCSSGSLIICSWRPGNCVAGLPSSQSARIVHNPHLKGTVLDSFQSNFYPVFSCQIFPPLFPTKNWHMRTNMRSPLP